MKLLVLSLAFVLTACGARTLFGSSVDAGDPSDAALDAGQDSATDAGPLCGDHPACGPGEYCCSLDRCESVGQCCSHDDCAEGLACPENGGVCGVGDLGCGLQELVPDVRPANVMLMLDRSESMFETIGDRTKWAIAAGSLHEVLPRFENDVRFGLTLFPGSIRACEEGFVTAEPGEAMAATILETVDATTEGRGGTPIGDTLIMLGESDGLRDPDFANFVLLVSDGSETCLGHPATVAATLFEGAPPIQIYPVGFGNRVDDVLLAAIASASHTTSGEDSGYWRVDDAEELSAALESILSSVIQCEFPLEGVPPVAARVYAFLGETPVPRDRENGFDYDVGSNRLTFFGDSCTAVRSRAERIRVVFGCPRGE